MCTVQPIRKIEDIRKIENILKEQNFRNYLIFVFGINTGLRISDILSLDVNSVRNKEFININEQKTHKMKKIYLNHKLKNLLNKYVKGRSDEEPLFKSVYNNRLDRFTAYRIIKKACICANLDDKMGTHTLRKTFGYHYYKKYNDIAMLQKIFNHSSPSITLRYIGIDQDEIDKSYKNFII